MDEPEAIALRFAAWRQSRFSSYRECSDELGIDRHTLIAIETGTTRYGKPYRYRPWIEYLMAGYDALSGNLRSPLSPKTVEAILAEVKRGASARATGIKFGVSPQAIRYHARKAGLGDLLPARKVHAERKSPVDLQKAAELIKSGASMPDVAAEVGCRVTTLQYHQKRGALPLTARQVLFRDASLPRVKQRKKKN